MANWVKLTRSSDDEVVWVNFDQVVFFFGGGMSRPMSDINEGTRIAYAGDDEAYFDVKEDLSTVSHLARRLET